VKPPIWAIPLVLAELGIVLFVGGLSPVLGAIAASETLLAAAYVLRSARRAPGRPPGPVSNVLSLFPGHLLLLLGISLLPNPDGLAALWAVVPIVSVGYDLAATHGPKGRARTSTLIGLYAILWAVLFTLLERVIAIGRGFERGEEAIAVVVLGAFGVLFISLGIYRHWRAGKE
jgi:hypothetical protein